ncbi:MAG: bifunctional phosphoserine phosphatase/homoserine phosphotransferase ThrH [Roseiflexaceae bacterium]|nr:bifunctional phosphoserine phosphatase/homoserine phosphotransferase ThrH [Roseiflexaceae bacterium]
MTKKPALIASDLEGVFVPEIWVAVAEKTGIEQLRLTTREIPDYNQLMQGRLALLREHGLTLRDIQDVIDTIAPLPGARAFLDELRSHSQVVILSDTFYEFAMPLMRQLGLPTLFCHSLLVDERGMITSYRLRQPDGKTEAVRAFKALGFRVLAMGDSYNDTGMLGEAETGVLFHAPANVIAEFPQFLVIDDYATLRSTVDAFLAVE